MPILERVATSSPLIPQNSEMTNPAGLVFEIRRDDPTYFTNEPHFERPLKPSEITEVSQITIHDVITGEPYNVFDQLQQPEPPFDPEEIAVEIIPAGEFSLEKMHLRLPRGYFISNPSMICGFLLGKQPDDSAFQVCFGDVADGPSSLGNPFLASSGVWAKPVSDFTFYTEGNNVIIGGKLYTPDQLKSALALSAQIDTELLTRIAATQTPQESKQLFLPDEVGIVPQSDPRLKQLIEEFKQSPLSTKCAAGFMGIASFAAALYAAAGILANRGVVRSKK